MDAVIKYMAQDFIFGKRQFKYGVFLPILDEKHHILVSPTPLPVGSIVDLDGATVKNYENLGDVYIKKEPIVLGTAALPGDLIMVGQEGCRAADNAKSIFNTLITGYTLAKHNVHIDGNVVLQNTSAERVRSIDGILNCAVNGVNQPDDLNYVVKAVPTDMRVRYANRDFFIGTMPFVDLSGGIQDDTLFIRSYSDLMRLDFNDFVDHYHALEKTDGALMVDNPQHDPVKSMHIVSFSGGNLHITKSFFREIPFHELPAQLDSYAKYRDIKGMKGPSIVIFSEEVSEHYIVDMLRKKGLSAQPITN